MNAKLLLKIALDSLNKYHNYKHKTLIKMVKKMVLCYKVKKAMHIISHKKSIPNYLLLTIAINYIRFKYIIYDASTIALNYQI